MSQARLNRIEAKQDQHNELLTEIRTLLIGVGGQNGLRSEVKALSARVDSLEALKNRLYGYAAALGLGGGFLGKWLAGGN